MQERGTEKAACCGGSSNVRNLLSPVFLKRQITPGRERRLRRQGVQGALIKERAGWSSGPLP